ncbi:hypothetical protein Tsubulata_038401 [Turnera subulata]|uniref:Zinc knuckle CX2CX4HX4C domain-containing protein n=1 Tax=Turnera subulata TaxID=218843 RepID=A0A9Q0FDN2_9ROSI|nr:hypothetical protein Tsubulata_038401 [Turnera subulata]
MVGETVKIDLATREHQRGRFAKIVVEVDLTKPLKGTIKFKGRDKQVIYEGLPPIRYQCGRVSHDTQGCPLRSTSPPSTEPSASPENNVQTPISDKGKATVSTILTPQVSRSPGVGEWMNAPSRPRTQQPRKVQNQK